MSNSIVELKPFKTCFSYLQFGYCFFKVGKSKPRLRTFTLAVVNRLDNTDENFKSKNLVVTFGHPTLIQVSDVAAKCFWSKKLKNWWQYFFSYFWFVFEVKNKAKKCSKLSMDQTPVGCFKHFIFISRWPTAWPAHLSTRSSNLLILSKEQSSNTSW